MTFSSHEEILLHAKKGSVRRLAVASAADPHTLEAVMLAKKDGMIDPILIGKKEKILAILEEMNEKISEDHIIDCADKGESARIAVRLIHEQKADFLMKGQMTTAEMLRPVVDKETGIAQGRVISHFSLMELPGYHKLIVVTDVGILIAPDLKQKAQIIQNAVDTLRNMGYEKPKVGVLCAIESVNPKMQETVDAAVLKEMAEDGRLRNCIVEGPISMDILMDPQAAKIKGYDSDVVGDPDIWLVPGLVTGNILIKALKLFAGAKTAAFACGASVPLVVTSRGESAAGKYTSIAIASVATVVPN